MAKKEKSFTDPKLDLKALGQELGGLMPPQDIEMEEAVLGALLLEPEIVSDVMDQIRSACFYKEQHRKIFDAISKLTSRSDSVDILSVANELSKTGELESVGGMAYLSRLSNKIGSAAHVDYHTKVLLEKFIQRELISISHAVQTVAYNNTMPVDDLVDTAEQKIFELAELNMRRDTESISSVINKAISEIEENQKREDNLSGVPSGYTNIDKVTFGWQKSDMIILAARPSVGKTAFVLTMARNMAVNHNISVGFFSLEMPATQLIKRIMVSETGLSIDKIRGAKKMNDAEWQRLHEGLAKLSQSSLWIDDTPSLSIYEFRSKARRLVQKNKVKIIIIDYLQLMAGPPELRGMREQEVAAISRNLKAIAKDLDIPIIALSQLSRAVETRGGNKRPQLSDLRESGAIEQDADIVMFIHRPEFLGVAEEGDYPGKTDIIIAKHRNGEVCDVPMRFLAEEVRFVDANDGPSYSAAPVIESKMNNMPEDDFPDMGFMPAGQEF